MAIATVSSMGLSYKGVESSGTKNYTRSTNLGNLNAAYSSTATGINQIYAVGSAWMALAQYPPGRLESTTRQTYTDN